MSGARDDRFRAAVAGLVMSVPGVGLAQERPLVLDRPGVLSISSERSPELRRARAQAEGALATAEASRSAGVANPTISMRAGPRFLGGDTGGLALDLSLALTWPFDLAGLSRARSEQLRSAATTAERSLDEARWRAGGEALAEWAAVAAAGARAEVARARLTNDRELLRVATVRRGAGSVGDGDVAVAEGLVAASEAELTLAEGEAAAGRARLRVELGLSPDRALEVPGATGEGPPPEDLEALVRRARERPDVLRALASRVEAERERETQRRVGGALPRLATQVSREEQWSLQVGFELSLPFFDRNQVGRAQADARARSQSVELELARSRAEAEVRSAWELWSAARAALRSLERASAAMTSAEALARRGYELGQRDLASALSVRREAMTVFAQRAEALGRLSRARASLDAAGGTL